MKRTSIVAKRLLTANHSRAVDRRISANHSRAVATAGRA
jgi:hypothetical protein